MKKRLFIFIFLFLCFPSTVLGNTKEKVTFSKCIDGDTAKFILNDKEITVRFLAIDTPETKKEEQPFGKEASLYTCNKIKNAKSIVLEFDSNSDKYDKYNRYLAWVFVDDNLLQKDLISNGFARVAYIYGDYKYTDDLYSSEKKAKSKKIGIWNDNKSFADYIKNMDFIYKFLITLVIILSIIIYLYFDNKAMKKAIRKGKKKIKKDLIKKMK